MKILIVNTVAFAPNGITAVIMNYFRHIDKKEIQMDFVAVNEINNEYRREIEKDGSQIYILPRTENSIMYMIELRRILKRGNYDAIHIHGNSATMAIETVTAWLAGVPIRIVHSHNTKCKYIRVHKLLYPLFVATYTHALACGDEAGKWLYKDKPFVVLKNGIEMKKYAYNINRRNTIRRELDLNDKVVIGHVGNFVEQKNHTFLLDVYSELIQKNNEFFLILIGDGVLSDEIKCKAQLLGIEKNVIFTGQVDNVCDYLQAMDIFVLPSHHEGVPVALIEMQAAGLQGIVSSNVDTGVDVTDSMIFIPNDDVRKWIEEIGRVTEDLNKINREKTCIESQKKLSESGYDIEINANILEKMYLSFVK